MKRFFVLVISLMMVLSFAGCGNSQASKGGNEILTAAEYWYHFDEVTGENEKMSFNEDGSFYWGCECGEPIGDSDLLELYDYDAKKKPGCSRQVHSVQYANRQKPFFSGSENALLKTRYCML